MIGKTELELPDTRKRMGVKASFVNVYPFVWNDFAKSGYVTGNCTVLITCNTIHFYLYIMVDTI